MSDLEPRGQLLLNDLEEVERVFQHSNIPSSTTNVISEHNRETHSKNNSQAPYTCSSYRSELEEMEQNFIDSQLGYRTFKPPEPPNQSIHIADTPMLQDSDIGLELLPNEINITNPNNDQLGPGDTNLNTNIQDYASNMYPYQPMLQEDILFDPMVLELMNFDVPTGSCQTIDMATYVSKAATEYGEEFSKKVEENLRILYEAMKGTSKCCNRGETKGLCCNGKCWGYVESRWREMQKASKGRGRRKKASKLSPEQIEITKHHQRIRNRIAAARTYYREKTYINNLEVQVQKLRAENKIRRNLVKFLESSLHITHEKRSLGRTISGPL